MVPASFPSADDRPPLFARRPVRLALIAAVGLYLFTICAAYMNRAPIDPPTTFAAIGPHTVRAGETVPLRVVAYQQMSHRQSPATIRAASLEVRGESFPLDVPSGAAAPSLVTVPKAPAAGIDFQVKLELSSADSAVRTLFVPLMVYPEGEGDRPVATEVPEKIPPENGLLLELYTEGPGLAPGQRNRVWVRVTLRDGSPARDAGVVWTLKGAVESEGRGQTDFGGLVPIYVTPNTLTTRFNLTAELGEHTGTLETKRAPSGRPVMLWPSRLVQSTDPGEGAIVVTVTRSDASPLFCDLYRGPAWLQTWHFDAGAPRDTKIDVDLPQAGVYRFQCYTHYFVPGGGSEAIWLFASDKSRVRALRELLLDLPASGRMKRWLAGLSAVELASRNAMLVAFRTSDVEVEAPPRLASTREHDKEAARIATDTQQVRYFVLIGASFALIILWALYYAAQTAIESRRRMAAAVAELGDLAVPIPPPTGLMRFRKAVQVAFIVIVLSLNVIAMLELFKYL